MVNEFNDYSPIDKCQYIEQNTNNRPVNYTQSNPYIWHYHGVSDDGSLPDTKNSTPGKSDLMRCTKMEGINDEGE